MTASSLEFLTSWSIERTPSFDYARNLTAYVVNSQLRFKLLPLNLSSSDIEKINYLASNQLKGLPREILQMMSSSVKDTGSLRSHLRSFKPYIKQASPLMIHFKMAGYNLTIATLTGHSFQVLCEVDDTVADLKGKIFDKTEVPADQQRLIFEGKQLQNEQILNHYKIPPGEKVHLVLRMRGGAFSTLDFVNADNESRVIRDFGPAPTWRTVRPGLNLKGTCTTEGCNASNQSITIPLGMGTFSIHEVAHTIKCPECKQRPAEAARNCVFFNCYYSIVGQYVDPDGQRNTFPETQFEAPSDRYVTFQEYNRSKWDYLTIETSRKGMCSIL